MTDKQSHGAAPQEEKYQHRMYSPNIDMMMREVLHTLGNIDFEHQVEMEKLENSNTDEKLKEYIKEKIRSAHRQRREPYVDLLTSLRKQQHRLAFAA